MSEENTKMAIVERQKQRLADLAKENKDQDTKLKAKDAELDKAEKEQQRMEREKAKLDKRIKHSSGRAERLAVDGIGSTGAQLLNFGEQTLLDYLSSVFPKSFGTHQVLSKSVPPVLALVWYLLEIFTMGQQVKLGKQMRITAANILANLGFVHLGQAYWRDQDTKKATATQLGQSLEEIAAAKESLQEELDKAKALLKAKGIAFGPAAAEE